MKEQHSRVNFRKLVRDLADMYGDATFDVVVTELVANALDAKAAEIRLGWNSDDRVLVVEDDGNGMDPEAFEQYHDFATELKTRGEGIGFAGMGAKISFNIANRVVTETHCHGIASASDWRWDDSGSLLWNRIDSDRLQADGTRVEVHFRPDEDLGDVDAEYIVAVLRRHYWPLFATDFLRAYETGGIYPTRPRFQINKSPIGDQSLSDQAHLKKVQPLKLRLGNRSIGWGALGISERDGPLGDGAYGVLLCTYGKAIKTELFGLSTGLLGARLFGIVEIPDLIYYLTTNKADLRGGPGRSQGLNRLLNSVREELRKFLAQHGIAVVEPHRNQLSAKLERELVRMVKSLPELQDFDGLLRRSQRLRKDASGTTPTSPDVKRTTESETSKASTTDSGLTASGGTSRRKDKRGKTPAKRQRSRNNQGPRVAFEDHPDRGETAWLDSDTVIINSGHTAYRKRVNQDQARLTYCMFAIGVALDKSDLIEPDQGLSYVDKFIGAWGQA